ncbi:hypothetical protein BH20ACT2_BH20ACT2_21280 [soil metagenome]
MWSVGLLGGLWLLFGAGLLGVRIVEKRHDLEMSRFDRTMRSFGDAVAALPLDDALATGHRTNTLSPRLARQRAIRLVLLVATTVAVAWHLVVGSELSAALVATGMLLATGHQVAALMVSAPPLRPRRELALASTRAERSSPGPQVLRADRVQKVVLATHTAWLGARKG